MIAADPPPHPPTPPPEVVLSRQDDSKVIASRDTPMVLVKAGRREEAMLRQAMFVTGALRVVQPAEGVQLYRWTYRGFLQRQLCVSSITGLFTCTDPQVRQVADAQDGQSPFLEAESYPAAETARARLTDGLKAQADGLFATDRRTNVEPLLKAAGVAIWTPAKPAARR